MEEKHLEIPTRYNSYFNWQKKILHDPARFQVVVAHRKARKTATSLDRILVQSYKRKGVYWHIFPSYPEAKETVWKDPDMLAQAIPEDQIRKKNEVELTVYLKNGSLYSLKGADRPDLLRGPNPVGVVLDERASMKAEVWTAIIRPILAANQGWCWFVGTPKGRNHFYNEYKRGLEGGEWKSWVLKASETDIILKEELEESRKLMPPFLYNQEFECEFLEGEGTIFRGVEEVATASPKEPEENRSYVMGVDLGKRQDYTVLCVYDRSTREQVYQERFKDIEWPFQKKKIRATAERYNHALIIMDSTGLGDPIFDDLSRAGVGIEPFKFTNETKKNLIEKLSVFIEQKFIRMLNIEETLSEFEHFTYELSPMGRVKYGAPSGLTDDIVIAQALAVWDLTPLPKQEKVDKPLSRIAQYKQKLISENFNPDFISAGEWAEWGGI